jgi:hypothetical protein
MSEKEQVELEKIIDEEVKAVRALNAKKKSFMAISSGSISRRKTSELHTPHYLDNI